MARTESAMLPLGTLAPAFQLLDVTSGLIVDSENFAREKPLLVMFICRHCPYVKHVQKELAQIGSDYAQQPVAIIAISSNDAEAYPEDAPDSLRQMAAELGFKFPLCFDETQDVARAFGAVSTPEFYVFDRDRKLAYRGQLDNSRRHTSIPLTGEDVRSAIESLLHDRPVNPDQQVSIGCSIKWKPAK